MVTVVAVDGRFFAVWSIVDKLSFHAEHYDLIVPLHLQKSAQKPQNPKSNHQRWSSLHQRNLALGRDPNYRITADSVRIYTNRSEVGTQQDPRINATAPPSAYQTLAFTHSHTKYAADLSCVKRLVLASQTLVVFRCALGAKNPWRRFDSSS